MRLVVLGLVAACGVTDAFQSSWVGKVHHASLATSSVTKPNVCRPTSARLGRRAPLCFSEKASGATEDSVAAAGAEEAAAAPASAESDAPEAAATEEEGVEATEEEGAEEEEEEEGADPEMAALQEEVAKLEGAVKSARVNLSNANDKLGDSGKGGYMRVAAKVQDFKMRAKKGKQGNEETAMVKVTESFMAVLDELLDGPSQLPPADEAQESLHRSYQALGSEMRSTFEKFGLEEFHAVEGEAFNAVLHTEALGDAAEAIVAEKGGNGADPGTVLAEVKPGCRMKGSTIRRALVVVSPQADAQAEDAAEAAAEDAAEAPPAAE